MPEPTESTEFSHTEKGEGPITPEAKVLSPGEKFSQDLDTLNDVITILLTDSSIDQAVVDNVWHQREDLCKKIISSVEPTPENPHRQLRVEFDLLADKAFIYERIGDSLRFAEELEEAEGFALAAELEGIFPELTEVLEDSIKGLGYSPREIIMKLRGRFNFAKRFLLREALMKGMSEEAFMERIPEMLKEEENSPPQKVKFFLT
ncbi:MAG: hypothetical protein ACOH18_01785 [Candidatus Saccharimonadaceae bacterium]